MSPSRYLSVSIGNRNYNRSAQAQTNDVGTTLWRTLFAARVCRHPPVPDAHGVVAAELTAFQTADLHQPHQVSKKKQHKHRHQNQIHDGDVDDTEVPVARKKVLNHKKSFGSLLLLHLDPNPNNTPRSKRHLAVSRMHKQMPVAVHTPLTIWGRQCELKLPLSKTASEMKSPRSMRQSQTALQSSWLGQCTPEHPRREKHCHSTCGFA